MQSCYDGKTDLDLLRVVRECKPRSPDQINTKIPKELSAIIMKALSKKPSQRYDTAGDFADTLDKFQKERFGSLSQDDVSAFLRSYFKFELADMAETISLSDLSMEDLESQRNEDLATRSNPQIRAPWVQRERVKLTTWIYPTMIGTILLLAAIVIKPKKIFESYDRLCIAGVEAIQSRLGFIPSDSKSKTIRLRSIPIRQSQYKVLFSAKAKETLDDLPFDTFDLIREAIDDLSMGAAPQKRLISNKQENPYLAIQKYKVEVIPNSMTKTLLVQAIVQAGVISVSKK